MNTDPHFLSFKGLKQYTPDAGWAIVPQYPKHVRVESPVAPPSASLPVEVPTSTETPQRSEITEPLTDTLIRELFEQLQVGPTDDLTQAWCVIASDVNQLSQHMALHRELQEQLTQLNQEMTDMRQNILLQLQQVQQAADQQLVSARLRSEVSLLAYNKLTSKLSTA